MINIANRIANRRHELGLTREQLADRANCAKSSIERWEKDGAGNIQINRVQELADALEVSPEYLVFGLSESGTWTYNGIESARLVLRQVIDGMENDAEVDRSGALMVALRAAMKRF
jgi:Predicted transcriptional regulators